MKIETGATPEQEVAASETRAREARSTWARNFNSATELGKADLLKRHIDTSAARFLYIGDQFAREWRKGNEGRGQTIPASEFRDVIDNSIAKDRALLTAWEDNMEYAWEWVRDSSSFDDYTINLFSEMVDHYYEVYSRAFYPQEDVETYVDQMNRAEIRMEDLSRDLASALNRYR